MQQPEAYSGVENLEIMQEAKNYNRYLLDTICRHAPRKGRILDFGAGNGEFAVPMRDLGFDVTAVEPDDLLRRKLGERRVHALAGPGDLQDASLDYIYTLNVLEHIEDDVGALRALHS